MTPPARQLEILERVIARVLQKQPPRPAPPSLEDRVMTAIAQRAAPTWWQKGFLRWPLSLRLSFLLASAGFVRAGLWLNEQVAITLLGPGSTNVASVVAPGIGWMRTATDVASGLSEVVRVVSVSFLQSWLSGGGMALLLAYAMLLGLGALGLKVLRPSV
jgi:hypothetical protein